MKHARFSLSVALVLTVAVFSAGCEDHKAQISMLEDSNRQLMDDLNAAREQLAAAQRSNDACQSELAMARGQLGDLQTQLSSRVEPELPAGWQAVPGGAMIAIDDSVLFQSGKADLRPEARRTVDSLVSVLNGDYSAKEILVFGHTDDEPIKKSGWKDNYQLSAERSLSVVRALRDRGVNPRRLVACGCGEYRPRVPNASADTRKQNRRVEIFALDAEIRTARR